MSVERAGEFRDLVEELADLEERRVGTGGVTDPQLAGRRLQVERRLIELLQTEAGQDERRSSVRLECDLAVRLKIESTDGAGRIADIGSGGVGIATTARAERGQSVEIEIERRPGTLEHSLRVRGTVAWVTPPREGVANVGVVLAQVNEPAERRLRRFVIELLRNRLPAPA